MANVTFSGPVRSQGGFEVISINASTGAVTTGSVFGTDMVVTGTVILSGLPTSDPNVADAVWSNAGVLTLSAG